MGADFYRANDGTKNQHPAPERGVLVFYGTADIAGGGLAPPPSGYEPDEVLLLYPAFPVYISRVWIATRDPLLPSAAGCDMMFFRRGTPAIARGR